MRFSRWLALLLLGSLQAAEVPPSNGVPYPEGWERWQVLSVSYREDLKSLRVILGNKTATSAARRGQTNPWPEGTVLGKVVWKRRRLPEWSPALVPGELVHVEFLIKDKRYADKRSGWAFARWVGPELKPFNEGMGSCLACHQKVKARDFVFTRPAPLP